MGSLEAHEKRMSRFSSQPLEQAYQSKVCVTERNSTKQEQEKNLAHFGKDDNMEKAASIKIKVVLEAEKRADILSKNVVTPILVVSFAKNLAMSQKIVDLNAQSARDCWYLEKKETNEANFSKEKEVDQLFYSCMDVENVSQNICYLDSGCSNHMTGNREMFVKLDDDVSSQVKLGDGKLQDVEGKGIVAVHTKGGDEQGALEFFKLIFRAFCLCWDRQTQDLHIYWVLFRGRSLVPISYEVVNNNIDGSYPSSHYPIFAEFMLPRTVRLPVPSTIHEEN